MGRFQAPLPRPALSSPGRRLPASLALSALLPLWLAGCSPSPPKRQPFQEADALTCPPKTERVEDKTSAYPSYYCIGFDGREGPWLEFDTFGRLKTTAVYVHDKLNGTWTSYHPDGSVDTTGQMVNNLRNGLWKQFYVNGNLRSEKNYLDNAVHGEVKLYYQTGILMAQGRFDSNFEEGPWQVYTPEGKLARECEMTHGKESKCTILIKDFQITSKFYSSSERGAL